MENANLLTPNSFPEFRLKLKVGCLVILLKNISVSDGLCNGTRMCIQQCGRTFVVASILFGDKAGRTFTFCRSVFMPDLNSRSEIEFKRMQLPFRLAFSITINRSQGQTFDRIGLRLNSPVFAHGQLYVAFSRVRSRNCIQCQITDIPSGHKQQGYVPGYPGVYTKNIVYESVLCKQPTA